MSKRVQTTNLNLYAYENLRGLPTFLKDWSDNMLILDGAYVTVNGLISALDTRLTTAEDTLEDLSPESIEDYKIRLDALEKKVVINTNAIKDVNTRIGTINAQINSINVEQGVQNSRLTALEGVTANHTSQINSMIGDISSVTGRVTTLEQCCETVQHEIADMQSDINGFNDDLTVLATQFETVSDVVSELTDLVNSLQLDVVSQRLDTFESDLDTLTASVTSLGDRMTDAENQIELNGNAINENALDIANIESEMGNTDYSEVGNTVSSAIVELADRIRSLTPQDYEVLVQAIQDAEREIDDIQALIPNDATSSNKLITLNDVVIPSVNIASASRAGIIKVGQRLSVQADGTLDADNQIGDSSYGLVKNVNDNASAISGLTDAVSGIQGVIPDTASPSNMLATMANLGGSNIEHFVDTNITSGSYFSRASVECELTDFVLFTILPPVGQYYTYQAYYFMLPVYTIVNMINCMAPNSNNSVALIQLLYLSNGQAVEQYLYNCMFYKSGTSSSNNTYYDSETKTLYITFSESVHSGTAKLDGYLIKCR